MIEIKYKKDKFYNYKMTSLKIPQLNLFNNRRHNHQAYNNIQSNTQAIVRNFKTDREFRSKQKYIPTRQHQKSYHQQNIHFSPINYKSSIPTRYKQIADNYLERAIHIPVFRQPIYHGYEPKYQQRLSPFKSSNYKKTCECNQEESSFRKSNDKKIQNNPYISEKSYTSQMKKQQKQIKIQKDPYLMHTFRAVNEASNRNKQFIQIKKSNKISENASSQAQNIITSKQDLPRFVERIKTNQSGQQDIQRPIRQEKFRKQAKPTNQAQIQTQKSQNNSSLIHTLNQKVIRKPMKNNPQGIQAIINEQRNLMLELEEEYRREDDYRVDFTHLEETRKDYVDKSHEIFFKLNQIAENQKDFSVISKFFITDKKKKDNIFWALENQ